jgi:hypothetical protein
MTKPGQINLLLRNGSELVNNYSSVNMASVWFMINCPDFVMLSNYSFTATAIFESAVP